MTNWTGPDGEPTLADVQAEFPGYECWRGTSGLYHARPKDLPGAILQGEDPRDLRDQIIHHQVNRPTTRRDKAVTRLLMAADAMRTLGLDVHAVPVGSDVVTECRGAVTQLTATNPKAPETGVVHVHRDHGLMQARLSYERWVPLKDDGGIAELAQIAMHILSVPLSGDAFDSSALGRPPAAQG